MVLARAFSRPFWTCRACRSNYVRSFNTTSANEFPRQSRQWQNSAPIKPDDTEASSNPLPGNNFHTLESDALGENAGPSHSANNKSTSKSEGPSPSRRKEKKPLRSDGISNLSNKMGAQRLRIPSEFVEYEESSALYKPQKLEPSEETMTPKAAPQAQEQPDQTPMSHLPWYLQTQYQKPIPVELDGSMAERVKLPDLPTHPPEQLEEILQYLSIRAGLDYLTLLDLRKLDPPPALGNNLIMIIGTCRDEKHVSVAAQQFCGWLRKEHKLTPYPDGMLGRNELFRMKKRSAKRSKAFGSTNVSIDSVKGYGLHPDWVCIHAGYLKPHPDAPLKDASFVNEMIGFGKGTNHVTLVVQLFTEDRRKETDLEALWEDILARNLKTQAQHGATSTELNVDGEELQVSEEDAEHGLTEQELEARKKFKLADKTILDQVSGLESHAPAPSVIQPS